MPARNAGSGSSRPSPAIADVRQMKSRGRNLSGRRRSQLDASTIRLEDGLALAESVYEPHRVGDRLAVGLLVNAHRSSEPLLRGLGQIKRACVGPD
jgi:hypothetical protein